MPNSLHDAFAATPSVAEAMDERALIAGVFAFEAALARAQGELGVIPAEAADVIAATADEMSPDPSAIAADAARAGALTIPLVKMLIAQVREREPAAAGFVHFGATSQDAMDTALVLQLDWACAAIDADLARLAAAAAGLSEAHRATLMSGRTLMQPATPVAFGAKAAQWLLAACEDRARLRVAAREGLRIQFGGAAGNLGSLGDRGPAIAVRLAALLPLRFAPASTPPVPWHTRRGGLMSLFSGLAIAAGGAGKIARDLALMAQWEVGEVMEAPEAGRGVSSAMPHKRNPVRCLTALAASARAPALMATLLAGMAQEHERALGGWQAEWAAAPELVKAAGAAVANMADALEGLIVDTDRMRANLDSLRGLPLTEIAALALSPAIGRDEAHAVLTRAAQRAVATGESLADALMREPAAMAHLGAEGIARALDPANALGASGAIIDHALSLWRAQTQVFNEGEKA